MPNTAFINSKFLNFKDAKIHVEDRGLQFADSVYEVIAVVNKNLIDLKFHFQRLKYSLGELNIKYKILYYFIFSKCRVQKYLMKM